MISTERACAPLPYLAIATLLLYVLLTASPYVLPPAKLAVKVFVSQPSPAGN
jgi:hypothetical protein